MNRVEFITPNRPKKLTLEAPLTEVRSKISTLDSRMSRDSKMHESRHWADHEKRKENRLSSLMKARRDKLQEITGQNRKIFIRINQQQAHYPAPEEEKAPIKFRDENLGPICNWAPPSYFLSGSKGIMCQSISRIATKPERKKLPSLYRGTVSVQKENKNVEQFAISKKQGSLCLPSNRNKRDISELYMLV